MAYTFNTPADPRYKTPTHPATAPAVARITDIATFQRECGADRSFMAFHAQLTRCIERHSKGTPPKPYYEAEFGDATGSIKFKCWSDKPAAAWCRMMAEPGEIEHREFYVEVFGTFSKNEWGVESNDWNVRPLSQEERDALFLGPAEIREKQRRDYDFIVTCIQSMRDLHFQTLCTRFLSDRGLDFRRAAAARTNHHARPGGLVEHVAGMMRAAYALTHLYNVTLGFEREDTAVAGAEMPSNGINRDLLLTGVLFHDIGKLVENQYTPDSFTMPFTHAGELLGHIAIGCEWVRNLWWKCEAQDMKTRSDADAWPAEKLLHLQHLVLSHHGTKEWGSPVEPRTYEAMMLHYIDNLDARMEMLRSGFARCREVADGITDKIWPLNVGGVRTTQWETGVRP